jgi:hypothetical protein
MAVFVSASDESDGGHHRSRFWHGGWVAPEKDWSSYFAPAWQDRVLDAKPSIKFLHMTDIRDPDWRNERGISWLQAQDKLDEAARVIDAMGSLYPIVVDTDAGAFLDAHGKKKVMENVAGNKAARYLVDYFCFNTYVFTVLHYIHLKHPYAEKVDFIVERKEGVFEKIKQFYESLDQGLEYIGRPELVKYLGEIIPAGKDRVPVQAADILCWHASRADLGTLKDRDLMRANTIFNRKGKRIPLPDQIHHELARAFSEKMNENQNGVSEIRRSNEEANPSSSREVKRGSGRRQGQPQTKKAEV